MMESHNFNILESKVKQAISEIVNLKRENAELRSKMNESSTTGETESRDFDSEKKAELIHKVDEMLKVLDEI
ncbi:MAG: hypothetical protein IIB41_05050 [Candidatus Marinimicrobia bacterium]|nr:hypothetical protein [Candidatus Neomarinimicrobiota bacterium]